MTQTSAYMSEMTSDMLPHDSSVGAVRTGEWLLSGMNSQVFCRAAAVSGDCIISVTVESSSSMGK